MQTEVDNNLQPHSIDCIPKTSMLPIQNRRRFVFQKKLVKIPQPLPMLDVSRSNVPLIPQIRPKNICRPGKTPPMVHLKVEPSDIALSSDFEEVTIDGSGPASSPEVTILTDDDPPAQVASDQKTAEIVVYMCNLCKAYFPEKHLLELHHAKLHTKGKRRRTEDNKIYYMGYYKHPNGCYVCCYCSFKSFVRTTVASHAIRKHTTLIQINADPMPDEPEKSQVESVVEGAEVESLAKVEISENENEDEDNEAFWPMEALEEDILEEKPQSPKYSLESSSKALKTCSYCPFQSSKSSTFHSHVKRKHRERWLKSIAQKVAALQPDPKICTSLISCQFCCFKSVKRATMNSHMYRKHGSTSDFEKLEESPLKEKEEQDEDFEIIETTVMDSDAIKDDTNLAYGEEVVIEEVVKTAKIPDKCPFCPFETPVGSTLQSHLSRRHRTKKATARKSSSTRPITYSGRRPSSAQLCTGYACIYCTFVAATVASVNSHNAREHTGQRQPIKEVPVMEYDCDQCEYKSRNRRNMQFHLKKCHTTQANDEGMFACNICSYETLSRMGLQRHISIKHNKPRREAAASIVGTRFDCGECEFKCYNRKLMDWHKRQHSAPANADDDGNSYFCNDCEFSTWTKSQLFLHIRRKHKVGDGIKEEVEQPEFPYACEQCDYTSKSKHVMKVHVIRKHTNDYNHECELCGKKYKVKADLTNHMRFQHREQPIICDVCGKTCRNSNLLYLHQKFAHYKPDFECPICRRRMVSQVNLDDHILKQHEQRQDAVCEECGKTFTKNARLKIHMRTHTGVKPYTCKVCMKAFARRNGLRQHLLIHTGQRPYICDICGKSFTQKTGLISHRKSHPGSHPPLPRVTIDHVLSDLLNEEA